MPILPEIDYFSGREMASQPESRPAKRFQSASQPTTPSVYGHPHTPFQPNLALAPEMMTKPAQPNSPEARHNRHFHTFTGAARSDVEAVRPVIQQEVQTMIQPLASRRLELSHSESLPEAEIRPSDVEDPFPGLHASRAVFSRN